MSLFPSFVVMSQEESLELVFRSLPPGSSATVGDITKTIDATLVERGVEVSAADTLPDARCARS